MEFVEAEEALGREFPPNVWVADMGEVAAYEVDKACAAVGILGSEIDAHMFSFYSAIAALLRRRVDHDLPDDEWKRIKFDDLVVVKKPVRRTHPL
jgi:hypothetical protein